MPTETSAQYRARVASNAAKTGSQASINRAPIPGPAQPALNVPARSTSRSPRVTQVSPVEVSDHGTQSNPQVS
jgi:hypothetical protein